MSEARSPKPSWKREFLSFFGSIKLVIGLLLAIALASVVGTILPQDQGPSVVASAKFAPWLKSVLMAIQAYDVYHAPWFDFLLALLFLNLAVCTYLRFPPTWRRYQMSFPPVPPVTSLQEVLAVSGPPTAERLALLAKRGYHVDEVKPGVTFAEKAKFVRLGPTFIHISLFAIILGAIWGGLAGTKNQVPLVPGERISSADIFKGAYQHGPLARPPKPFDLQLDGFRMDFHPNGVVKQYYSDVTIVPRTTGEAPIHQTLWVNEPAIYDGQYFYQSTWGIGAFAYALDGVVKTKQPLVQAAKIGGYLSRPLVVGDESYILLVRQLEEPATVISTRTLKPVGQLVPGFTLALGGHSLKLIEYNLYSGFETKNDPGIPLVYFGCGLLIFGLALVPVSHRELWIREGADGWVLAGRTHKGRLMLRREMAQIAEHWGQPAAPSLASQPVGAQAS